MTEAEKTLLEAVLACRKPTQWGEELDHSLDDAIDAVREERCPEKLLAAVKASERAWQAAQKERREVIEDLKLNYPPEMVEAACSRARKELRNEAQAE